MSRERSRGSLDVRGITKRFGTHTVLDRVSFQLEPGTLTCLNGGNGAGKSTLVRCLTGLTRFSGYALLDGIRLPDGVRARKWMGYVPQHPAFDETATVEETLHFFARLRRARPVVDVLPTDFIPTGRERVGSLSGGQRQRLAFAIGLLDRPRLLLLDEPVSNMDDQAREAVWSALERLRNAGTTIMVVTPSLGDLADLVDGVLTLEGGVLTGDGSPHRLSARMPLEVATEALGVSAC